MSDINRISLNGVDYRIDDDKLTAFANGESISYNETLSEAQTLYKSFSPCIPSGSKVLVENNSSTTAFSVAFRDSTNTEITDRITIDGGKSTYVAIPSDAYSVRLYVNGTVLNVTFSYGADVLGKIDDINNVSKLSVGLNNGYYSAQGTVVAPSSTSAEKYTDKITVFEGLKLMFVVEHINSGHNPWDAICEWKKDGTFVRTALNPTNYRKNVHIYEATDDVDSIAFTFRSYNDYEFTASVVSNNYDLFEVLNYKLSELSSKISWYSYAFDADAVKGVNHRGYNTVAPENTLPAYKLSVENGFKFVETDVRMTSDNVPVLLHDATIDRTSNGTGNIADLTFAQVREYDFGSWKSSTYAGTKIPSFEEFIVFCKRTKVYPYVELSGTYTNAQVEIIYNIVKQYGMTKAVTWIGSNHTALNTIKGLDQYSRFGVITWGEATQNSVTLARALMTGVNQVFLNLDITYATTAVSIAKAAGVPLELWTSNSADAMKAVDPYVNGVASDTLNFETVIREYALS